MPHLDVVSVEVNSAQFVPVAEDDVRRDGIVALAREPVNFQLVAVETLAFVLRLHRPKKKNLNSKKFHFIQNDKHCIVRDY